MAHASSTMPPPIETIGELRQLYRDAESRAARLRLLSESGRTLAEADAETIDEVLRQVAERLAFFLGQVRSEVDRGGRTASGLPIPAPGGSGRILGSVRMEALPTLEQIEDDEDRETARLQLELMGLAIDRVERDAERGQLLGALKEREQRLEYVVGRLFAAQEEERRRVSHELHDGVAQTATALVRLLEGSGESDRTRLANIGRELVRELRGVIGNLRPPLLDDLGLEAALQSMGEELRSEGFTVKARIDGGGARWPRNVETALFRVAQEAVANIRKHSGGPCPVEISLAGSRHGEAHRLIVADEGRGCSLRSSEDRPPAKGEAIGIDVMRERMAAIGGELRWVAAPGVGVTVTALLPVGSS